MPLKPDHEDYPLMCFLKDYFNYDLLQKAGFWRNGERRTDYHAQSKRICNFFCLNSVFDYATMPPFIKHRK
ncbi:MAG: hypothetical protein JWQ09_5902 [Segetibacter sp.]|nr:hypothetical protein [Segetibacter sp.]